jgi:hypothetical protein
MAKGAVPQTVYCPKATCIPLLFFTLTHPGSMSSTLTKSKSAPGPSAVHSTYPSEEEEPIALRKEVKRHSDKPKQICALRAKMAGIEK